MLSVLFLVVSVVLITAAWTTFFGGSFDDGVKYGFGVIGGFVVLLYAVYKRYGW